MCWLAVASRRATSPPPLDLLQALDAQAETFTAVGTLRVPRVAPVAVQLADGQVLIAGGDPSHLGSKWRSGLPIETWNPTPGASARPLPEFDAPVAPLAARLLRDGRVAIAACDRTILWDPETATWARSDDLPPNCLSCRIVARGAAFLAITPEGCTYELGASE